MASPLTDPWPLDAARPQELLDRAVPPASLPAPVRGSVIEIAAAPGAWCPALSPAGTSVA